MIRIAPLRTFGNSTDPQCDSAGSFECSIITIDHITLLFTEMHWHLSIIQDVASHLHTTGQIICGTIWLQLFLFIRTDRINML